MTTMPYAYLTKFELARVLGLRTLQLQASTHLMDAPPLQVAIHELLTSSCPMIIRRYLCDGTHHDVAVRDLLVDEETLHFQLDATVL